MRGERGGVDVLGRSKCNIADPALVDWRDRSKCSAGSVLIRAADAVWNATCAEPLKVPVKRL